VEDVLPDVERMLIFDLGMHLALDTHFYLQKGFRVIAVEAAPMMIENARTSLSRYIGTGQLVIVDRAFWSVDDEEIPFYINKDKDDWSSAFKWWAEKGAHQVQDIKVKTTTLARLFEEYGVPYYIKCDIEGADELFVRQLLADRRRPSFVSIEATSLEALAVLYAAGFDRVQLVNQAFNGFVQPPEPAREGNLVPVKFNGHMSGLFGRELKPEGWTTFTQGASMYLDYRDLKRRNDKLAHGWLDFHVTTAQTLSVVGGA
jgi:FkbM family methyltransferase